MNETGARPGVDRTGVDRPAGGVGLVGDIGGTNARFALAEPGDDGPRIAEFRSLPCRDFKGVAEALAAYLDSVGLARAPGRAVIAVAGPVTDGTIHLTNLGWSASESELQALGFGRVRLVNDYAALALGAPRYPADHLRHAGGPAAGRTGETLAVIGAGTGFGVAALARDADGQAVMATEGGHMGFAPVDALEIELLKLLMARFGRVSIERILSGPGLATLHAALGRIHGERPDAEDPAAITRAAQAGDAASARSVEQFCAILGSVSGDLALAFGARGGVYVGGGIAPAMGDLLPQSRFRRRFEAKGRFEGYMQAIPTWIITHPHAALLGAATALAAMDAR